jgi:hypothetical protein
MILKKYTFDIIRKDSFPNIILIRFSNKNDCEGDIFESLRDCRKAVNNNLLMDVFICSEILHEIL